MYEFFEHTADLGVRIRSHSFESLLTEGGHAFFSILLANIDDVRVSKTITISIAGKDKELLFCDWLSELLNVFELKKMVCCNFEVRVNKNGIIGKCHGENFDPTRHQIDHEVKAVTYHGLKVEKQKDIWLAEVILDI